VKLRYGLTQERRDALGQFGFTNTSRPEKEKGG
jgi:hypothetical protein